MERKINDEVNVRSEWTSPVQFFLTVLGFVVGLGNIWRFPYLCQKHGGGSFIVPFIILLVIEGLPFLLLELAIGQNLRQSVMGVWHTIHPRLGGIGIGSAYITVLISSYYSVIISWCIYYLIMSAKVILPWTICHSNVNLEPSNLTSLSNMINVSIVPECASSSETEYFWYRKTLNISNSIEEIGGINMHLLGCLILSWIIIYFLIMKGINSSGKAVYFTALFPYVVLIIFLIRGFTLKGATAGLMRMFYPQLEKLKNAVLWKDAANQVFYSYGLAFGSLISFGSYNPSNNNVVRDAYIISFANAFTCLFACSVVFVIFGVQQQNVYDKCIEGNIKTLMTKFDVWTERNYTEITEKAYFAVVNSDNVFNTSLHITNCTMEDYLNNAPQGTGLAFMVIPEIFTKLPGAPFWSMMFFSMLISLGLGSQIGLLEGFISILFDSKLFKNVSKPVITGVTCLLLCLAGMCFITSGGIYLFNMVDNYGSMGLSIIAFIEIISVMYVYGYRHFVEDIKTMTGVTVGWYWKICLLFLSPAVLLTVIISNFVLQFMKKFEYDAWDRKLGTNVTKAYPTWATALSVILSVVSVVPIIVVALVNVSTNRKLKSQKNCKGNQSI